MVVTTLVKGVNKNIIEITDTGSDCFERAILFVRPDKESSDKEQLRTSAMRYLQGLRLRRGILPGRKLWLLALKYGAALAVGAVLASVFLRV